MVTSRDHKPTVRETKWHPRFLVEIDKRLRELEAPFARNRQQAEAFFAENAVAVTRLLLGLRTQGSRNKTGGVKGALIIAISHDGLGTERAYSPDELVGLSLLLLDTAALASPYYDHQVAIDILRELERIERVEDYDLVAWLAHNPHLFAIHPLVSGAAKEVLLTLDAVRIRQTAAETLLRPAEHNGSDHHLVRPATSHHKMTESGPLLRPAECSDKERPASAS